MIAGAGSIGIGLPCGRMYGLHDQDARRRPRIEPDGDQHEAEPNFIARDMACFPAVDKRR